MNWRLIMLAENQLSTIGLELKKHREQLNHSILDISRQMGVSPKCIVAIETGNLGFFAGAKSEIERLIKLYKRKLHMKADFLDSALAALNENNAKTDSESGLPSFLEKTISAEPMVSTKLKMPVTAKRSAVSSDNASSKGGKLAPNRLELN
jgi:cytoskeletal protein RodZ